MEKEQLPLAQEAFRRRVMNRLKIAKDASTCDTGVVFPRDNPLNDLVCDKRPVTLPSEASIIEQILSNPEFPLVFISDAAYKKMRNIKLTVREKDILQSFQYGESFDAIASYTNGDQAKVKQRIAALYKKLGVDTRVGAVAKAREFDLLKTEKKK